MGKTSVFNYISHPDVVQRNGLDPATHLFVYVDLQLLGPDTTPTRLNQHLLRRLGSKVKDPELKEQLAALSQQDSIDNYDLFDLIDLKNLYIVSCWMSSRTSAATPISVRSFTMACAPWPFTTTWPWSPPARATSSNSAAPMRCGARPSSTSSPPLISNLQRQRCR